MKIALSGGWMGKCALESRQRRHWSAKVSKTGGRWRFRWAKNLFTSEPLSWTCKVLFRVQSTRLYFYMKNSKIHCELSKSESRWLARWKFWNVPSSSKDVNVVNARDIFRFFDLAERPKLVSCQQCETSTDSEPRTWKQLIICCNKKNYWTQI